MEIKNLRRAAKRISAAIKSKENIILYGDADMDGISSVIILKEAVENLGGKVKAVYFPNREKDGYGINEKALSYLKKYSPALLIALDCGIGNFKEVKTARKIGFEVIIVDHHEILGKVPDASIVVDPKQPGDKYPFKQFAAVGLAFRLSEFLLGKKMTGALRNNFLELAAMATIADMMPRIADNEKIIGEGLSSLRESWRPGIQALFNVCSIETDLSAPSEVSGTKRGRGEGNKFTKGFNYLSPIRQVEKINSLLNIPDIEEGRPAAFRLLTCTDIKEAEKLAEKLFQKNIQKREKIREIIFFLEEKVFENPKSPIIFEGSSGWQLILLGTVASVISQRRQKPVFLYKKGKKESPGSVRAPNGFNVVEAMKQCSKVLINFGGHPQAAGFRIKNENLEKFRDCLVKYFR